MALHFGVVVVFISRLRVTRIANHIINLKVIPNGWLITFKYVGESKNSYGPIKDKRTIKFLQSLKQEIT